jgi:hypothetical protein
MDQLATRNVAKLLSGYLCGTHSGLLAFGRMGRRLAADPNLICSAHHALDMEGLNGQAIELGQNRWQPEEQRLLAEALRVALANPCVHDLVLYGSQARGGRTGFSDVDAILVVTDEAANDASSLRSLRPHVLRAQRAVLSYQPMQHHGFEVATPTLLKAGTEALALPTMALKETCSLKGMSTGAALTDRRDQARVAFSELASSLERTTAWPRHPWETHRLVAMFELLPTFYLQAKGAAVEKWRSFEVGRAEFAHLWWPYEVLQNVRQAWPRMRFPYLERAGSVVRNPWVVVAAWRQAPLSPPPPADALLTDQLLDGLRTLVARMREQAS